MSVAGEHRDRPVAGVADDQIGHAVAVQVGREDLRGLGTGGERGDLDETGRAQREERDALSFGVDAGERGTESGRDEGDVARRVARVDRHGRREAAGLARPARAKEDVAGRIDDGNIGGAVAVQVGDQGRLGTDEVNHRRAWRRCRRRCSARTCTSSGLVRVIARSVRPLPAKSPVAIAVEYPPIHRARRASRAGTCRRRCPGTRSSRRFHSRWHRRWPGRGCRCW